MISSYTLGGILPRCILSHFVENDPQTFFLFHNLMHTMKTYNIINEQGYPRYPQ